MVKPNDITIKKIKKTKINDYVIDLLEIDLKHINYGLNKNKEYAKRTRSSFSIIEVAKFFLSLDGIELDFDSDDTYDYFVVEKSYFSKLQTYRMVFCIERLNLLRAV